MSAQLISSIANILGVLVVSVISVVVGKLHINSKKLATAASIASEAVQFVAQTTSKLPIQDATKAKNALAKAKELAAKMGIKLTDSQWETLLESAYKQSKDKLAELIGTATPYTADEITAMIQNEVKKVNPTIPVDQITDLVKQEVSKLNLTVNVVPAVTPAPEKAQ